MILRHDKPTESVATHHQLLSYAIEHVSLDAKPQYSALSYVWGDEKDTVPLLLHGCQVDIITNLHSAFALIQLVVGGTKSMDRPHPCHPADVLRFTAWRGNHANRILQSSEDVSAGTALGQSGLPPQFPPFGDSHISFPLPTSGSGSIRDQAAAHPTKG